MIDVVEIVAQAGRGGNGAVSFRREKYVPRGGPDGGDGGDGGNVYVIADPSVSTLRRVAYQRTFRATAGGHGRGKKQHGKRGNDVWCRVPLGTQVWRRDEAGTYHLLADLVEPGQHVLVARGGKGGKGNARFATATRQAPMIAQKGESGETAYIRLEMKLLADVGLIGLPNAGKSTLLAAATAARPKIAPYPFTTLEPNLGVVDLGDASFVLADIPGLIEGAHAGRGLGHEFLRHIERTRLLVHVIDGTHPDPIAAFHQVNRELELYNPSLRAKRQLIALNKMDIEAVRDRWPLLKEQLQTLDLPLFAVSGLTGEGVRELMLAVAGMLAQLPPPPAMASVPPALERPPTVTRENGTFIVEHPAAERLVEQWDLSEPAALQLLERQLARLGVARALRQAGCRPGDRVRIGGAEWEWGREVARGTHGR